MCRKKLEERPQDRKLMGDGGQIAERGDGTDLAEKNEVTTQGQ